MRHTRLVVVILSLVLIFTSAVHLTFAQETTPEATPEATQPVVVPATATHTPTSIAPSATPSGTGGTHTVAAGENLYRIALRYGTTISALATTNNIVNPQLIYVGQVLRIPGAQATPAPVTPPPSMTAAPTQATTVPGAVYTVVPGDTLFRVAVRFNTTVAQLLAANNIPNPNIIYVGQRITIPGSTGAPSPAQTAEPGAPTAAATTAATTAPTTAGSTSNLAPLDDAGFAYGVEIFPFGQDASALSAQAAQLGVSWVKVTIHWRELEATEGQISFEAIDPVVTALKANNLNVLFTVTTSPTWARTSVDENGPPDDFADYATFVGALADRYAGQVNAYEIWSEPNLRREWNSGSYPIRADHYVNLLSAANTAIKAADPLAWVISAGLAPTGFNDGVNAINDRVFLQDMYSNGLIAASDAIGAHPLGWANPPDATCCTQPDGVATHFNDRSFFFLDTLTDYRGIMARNNDTATPIWVTKFGWGSSEGVATTPGQSNVFLTYTSLDEQAAYTARAFELGDELGFIGPMMAYNVNGCQSQFDQAEACYYALITQTGASRPAFASISTAEKPDGVSLEPVEPITPVETVEVEPTTETIVEPDVLVTPEATP